jgi:dTDP-4-amino-4,6-dideoxygalactose transaminase
MSEFHAALGLESLALLDDHLAHRRAAANRYCDGISDLTGLSAQYVPEADRSTYKDFTVRVDGDFGLDRDELASALRAEGIDTRPYFFPPVHEQQSYKAVEAGPLPITEAVSRAVLSLPMFGELALDDVDRVVEVLHALHANADAVRGIVS